MSDTHSRFPEIPSCDLIIHTGDWCKINFSLSKEEFIPGNEELTFNQSIEFLEFITGKAKKIVITSGNHEVFLNNSLLRERFEKECTKREIVFKDDSREILEVSGLKIGGAGMYPLVAQYMTSKHAYSHEDKSYLFNNISDERMDILLSHGCPEVTGGQFECEELEVFLRERERDDNNIPLLLCGHIHESRGEYKIGKTKVINSACATAIVNV